VAIKSTAPRCQWNPITKFNRESDNTCRPMKHGRLSPPAITFHRLELAERVAPLAVLYRGSTRKLHADPAEMEITRYAVFSFFFLFFFYGQTHRRFHPVPSSGARSRRECRPLTEKAQPLNFPRMDLKFKCGLRYPRPENISRIISGSFRNRKAKRPRERNLQARGLRPFAKRNRPTRRKNYPPPHI